MGCDVSRVRVAGRAGPSAECPELEKPRLSTWAEFQEEPVSDAIFERWFAAPPHGQMGLITGRASGGVFVVDLDTTKARKPMPGGGSLDRT
jgi:hypothetical protein